MTEKTDRGFVHADGGTLYDGFGNRIQLRGIGVGNWMLPEGYMWLFEPGPDSPRLIEHFIRELCGADYASSFWERFRAAFFCVDDLVAVREDGFDHIRLPINWRLIMTEDAQPIEAGLKLIDQIVDQCENLGLWVVLDLHGAPGGQTGTNIDDSPNRVPELFTSDHYRSLCVAVWKLLAQRYRSSRTVAGYDLLNEPIPNEYQDVYAEHLKDLYRELTSAIREVDPDHLLIYEGSHWSTNWAVFDDGVWDPNAMLQFHKYWSPPDYPSISQYVSRGRDLGLPIYMGEGGENNREWIATVHTLYEEYGISWNFWPWKKVETFTSPYSVIAPAGYEQIVSAARAASPNDKIPPGGMPVENLVPVGELTAEECRRIFDDLLVNCRISNCVRRDDVLAAMFRRAPLTLPASGFGFGGPGKSFDADGVPSPDFRSDETVTIRRYDGVSTPIEFFHVGGRVRPTDETLAVILDAGEWVQFEVAIPESSHTWRLGLSLAQVDGVGAPTATYQAADGDFLPVALAPSDPDSETGLPTIFGPLLAIESLDVLRVRVSATEGKSAFTALHVLPS